MLFPDKAIHYILRNRDAHLMRRVKKIIDYVVKLDYLITSGWEAHPFCGPRGHSSPSAAPCLDVIYLLYLDHSGNLKAGFSIFERQGYWISRAADKIAARFITDDPNSVELHASPMRGGSRFWRQFKVPDRITAIHDGLRILTWPRHGAILFGVVVKKDAISPIDPIAYAFEQICSRFDQYLWRKYKAGDKQRGIIVMDKATYETTLQNLATDFRTIGHTWGVVRNLSEVPLFTDSRSSRLVQLADHVCFALFRRREHNDHQYFEIIRNRFDTEGASMHGLHEKLW